MAKRKKPRTHPPIRPIPADLSAPTVAPTSDPPVNLAGIDVEPLFAALRMGALDGHLEELASAVNERFAAIDAIEELLAARYLRVGGRARLGHNLRPQYLHGRTVSIIAKEGEKWVVRLEEPVGTAHQRRHQALRGTAWSRCNHLNRYDARTPSVDSDLDPRHGFGYCECFCQTQIPH